MLKLRFGKFNGAAFQGIPILNSTRDLDPTQLVTYADNFVSTFFNNIITYINNDSIDNLTQPWIVDQVLTYSGAKKDFLDTFGSLARVGEGLMQRLYNVGTGNTSNGAVIEVAYRPPCSIYNTHILPPGAKHRIDFTWNQSIVNAFESLIGSIDGLIGTADGNYNIYIDSFYFYKATCRPNPMVSLPVNGVIDLAGVTINQHNIVNSNQWQQNITLKPTTNRLYLTFQDNNQSPKVTTITTVNTSPYIDNTTSIKYMGYGTGWTPATSFTKSFSTSYNLTSPIPVGLCELQQLYIKISDLALMLPHPPYNFAENGSDYLRAYTDWASQTVGTKYNDTGSVPFGMALATPTTRTADTFIALNSPGVTIVAPLIKVNSTTTATYQVGNPNNNQQLSLITNIDTNLPTNTNPKSIGFQTSEYGWIARHPGPIFCFNLCRPPGKKVSQGDVTVNFTGTPNAVVLSVICCYNRALAVSKDQFGNYTYQLVEGI
jgi:hypothetical protein